MTDTRLAGAGLASPRTAGVEAAGEQPHRTPQRPGGQGDRVVGIIPRGDRACIRAALTVYKGRMGLDLRLFEEYRSTGEMGPTSKGIRLRVDELARVRDAIEAALALAGEPDR